MIRSDVHPAVSREKRDACDARFSMVLDLASRADHYERVDTMNYLRVQFICSKNGRSFTDCSPAGQ